jgi:hypothetical protein
VSDLPNALALQRQSLGNPLGQSAALNRLKLQGHTSTFKRKKPSGTSA